MDIIIRYWLFLCALVDAVLLVPFLLLGIVWVGISVYAVLDSHKGTKAALQEVEKLQENVKV